MKDQYMENVFVLEYSRDASSDSRNMASWKLVDVGNKDQGPGPRSHHTATFCEAQGIFVFGGLTADIYATKDHPRLVEGSDCGKTMADNKVYLLTMGSSENFDDLPVFQWAVSLNKVVLDPPASVLALIH